MKLKPAGIGGVQDDIGGVAVGVGGVGKGDGVADLDLVGAGGGGLNSAISRLDLHLADGAILGEVTGEGLLAGGQRGLDCVASRDAGQVDLAGDVLALGDLRAPLETVRFSAGPVAETTLPPKEVRSQVRAPTWACPLVRPAEMVK